MATVNLAEGEAIAILNRNEPAFYCVSSKIYEYLMELADDTELVKLVEDRQGEESYLVDLADLLK